LSNNLTATSTGTAISYDAASGVISLSEPGIYLVAWNTVLNFDGDIAGTLSVSLESEDGSIIYATSTADATVASSVQTVSGSAIVLSDGNDSIVLINTSNNEVRYAQPITGTTNAEIQVVKIG